MKLGVADDTGFDQLPLPAADEFAESSLRAAPGRGPRRGRILVMDDSRMVCETMRRQLVIFGFEVATAGDGQEAVAAYQQARRDGRPFDLVILDLLVDGGWGGERTLAELRGLDPGVKAMVCSGSLSGPPDAYSRQGFGAVLAKPYSLEDLRRKVETTLSL